MRRVPSRAGATAPRAVAPLDSIEDRYWRRALFWVLVVTVARLMWLALDKTDLYPDEAQYWLWSLHPAFGYYSKPPLVAWIIAATTALFGDNALAVRVAAPLLHFATALLVYQTALRLYDARTAFWSAILYVTLPGVSASAMIMSTDAPLLLCWAIALYAFIRAREDRDWRWWLAVGVAVGFGLLAKYAMIYWVGSALIYLLIFRDERRHMRFFAAALLLAFLIYAPNLVWNAAHGFVSYHHTEANADLHGSLYHPRELGLFFLSQFGVFGPLTFAALIVMVASGARALAARPAALLACFTLPTIGLMLLESLLARAEPNWAAPAYVAASILVVAWAVARGWQSLVAASVALHVVAVAAILEARDLAGLFGYDLPAKYDVLHRLRGWKRLGSAVAAELARHPGAILMTDDREEMAALLFYVHPHPLNALKWNSDDPKVNDQFDLEAKPRRDIGKNFLLVSATGDTAPIVKRFAKAGPVGHIVIPLGGGAMRTYVVRYLEGFKGYH